MARQIASAIWHLHDVGVAHRDLKPDNVLCTHPEPHLHGRVKLCDFGLGALPPLRGGRGMVLRPHTHAWRHGVAASAFEVGEDAYLTKLAGTPEYLAPEVVRILHRKQKSRRDRAAGDAIATSKSVVTVHGHEAHYSERVDLWALGCVIYELLSGEPPFFSEDEESLYKMILCTGSAWIERVAPGLATVIACASIFCDRTQIRLRSFWDGER